MTLLDIAYIPTLKSNHFWILHISVNTDWGGCTATSSSLSGFVLAINSSLFSDEGITSQFLHTHQRKMIMYLCRSSDNTFMVSKSHLWVNTPKIISRRYMLPPLQPLMSIAWQSFSLHRALMPQNFQSTFQFAISMWRSYFFARSIGCTNWSVNEKM